MTANVAPADVVIVGAGAAGCVLARRLAERGDRKVLLLEAGPDIRVTDAIGLDDGWRLPTLPDWGYASDDAEPRRLRRGRATGGSSWFTRFAVRGAAADFDAWAAAGNPGWAWDDVVPTFRAIESDEDFGEMTWHGAGGPLPITRYLDLPRHWVHEGAVEALSETGLPVITDMNAPDAVGIGAMPMSTRGGRRVTALDAWLPEPGDLASLTIRSDAPVDRIQLDGRRATGVHLLDGTEIPAGQVILAAGTYGSPLVLQRSGIGPAAMLDEVGIRVAVDLPGVGEHLADHPAVDLDSGWRGDGVGAGAPILHSIATFRSSGRTADAGPDLMFWITDPDDPEPALFLDPILLKPRSRGRVRVRSADPADAPRITLPGLQDPDDIRRLAEGYERALDVLGRPIIGNVLSSARPRPPATADELRRRVIDGQYSIPHVVGTCRMGPDPTEGDVVDGAGRVHGLEALRVVDASILPDAPSGFPHVIVLMAAERIAATIA